MERTLNKSTKWLYKCAKAAEAVDKRYIGGWGWGGLCNPYSLTLFHQKQITVNLKFNLDLVLEFTLCHNSVSSDYVETNDVIMYSTGTPQ